jgi:hypothetical protein
VPREIGVYRSEVEQALRQLSGRNYKFDVEAWRQWYAQSRPALAPAEPAQVEQELAFKPLP